MIAKISAAKDFVRAIRYNELKVEKGDARLLLLGNIDQTAGALSAKEKIGLFAGRSPCWHISLNLHIYDEVAQEQMRVIAPQYLDRLGLGKQPYLVYQHGDTAHAHMHIVTTPVDETMQLNGRLRYRSTIITKQMEREFDLIRSRRNKQGFAYAIADTPTNRSLLQEPAIHYAEDAKTTAITTVLTRVLPSYRFTTLEELNAILRCYRMAADRGRPGSRIYEHRGLVYYVLDDNGRTQGMYVKASSLPGKPTLAFLEERFALYKPKQDEQGRRVRVAVDWALLPGTNPDFARLQRELQQAGIQTVWTIPKGEAKPTVTYVDHRSRWAFGEAALGPSYSVEALMERCRVPGRDLTRALAEWREHPHRLNKGVPMDYEMGLHL